MPPESQHCRTDHVLNRHPRVPGRLTGKLMTVGGWGAATRVASNAGDIAWTMDGDLEAPDCPVPGTDTAKDNHRGERNGSGIGGR